MKNWGKEMLFLSIHEKGRHRQRKNGLLHAFLMIPNCKHQFRDSRRTFRTNFKCSIPAKYGQVPLKATAK